MDEGICLENVSFAYKEGQSILNGVSLVIPKGSFVSLVGGSGCGKSTIAALLTGKQKNYEGSIRIGGKQLSELSEESILTNITVVTHNSYLFKGTVEENLRMGNPAADRETLMEALKQVNLYQYLEKQQGLQTILAEGGSNLSGGQRQRLAMARALLHDSSVYILDEATSNIDMESENMIMEVVRELAGVKTILLISHRLANTMDSDVIYVLDQGAIQEEGDFESLMKADNQTSGTTSGLYQQLYTKQFQLEGYSHCSQKERAV